MIRKKYKQIGKDVWSRHMEKQADSGQSVTAYCEKNGLSVSSFRRWRGLISSKKGAGFIRLEAQSDNRQTRTELAITTPNGYRVEISDAETAIAVARSLAGC